MAPPMTAASLVTALNRWHLKVVEHNGWRNNNRNAVGAWGPINGTMVHHTVTSNTAATVSLCYNGRSDLPGPLCHGVIAKDGTVYLVGNGRANHAGTGGEDVFDAVVNETAIPARPGPDAVDGNAHFYGWECINLGDGKDPWPEVQLDAIARVQAAICEHHRWGAGSVIGHREWTTRKIDPRGFSMASMRARITTLLTNGPEENDVPLTTDDINKVASAVAVKLIAGGGVLESSDVTRVAAAVATKLAPAEAAQNATIAELVKTVATLAANIGDLDPAAIIAELNATITAAVEAIDIRFDINP